MKEQYQKNRRVLVIDDSESIHEDFRAILGSNKANTTALNEAKAVIFSEISQTSEHIGFEIDTALQGQEGLQKVKHALSENRPYAMAFVDIRMPPGWDGVDTIKRIWQEYPELQVVICTAYSDYKWNEIVAKLGQSERLLILKKPFENVEVYQLASALTEKWNLARKASLKMEQLEQLVREQTEGLKETNEKLKQEITEREHAEKELDKLNKDLLSTIQKLERANKELKEFAHIAAHDLKSPLRAIGTLADWISNDYADKFDEQGKEQVKLLLTRTKQMSTLIDDILRYSRLGQTSSEKEQVDVNTILRELIEEINPHENIEVIIENELPTIMCEKTHIIQLFRNLLSNAVKYMDKPKGIIKVGYAEQDGFWRFDVSDNGLGIDKKYHEKIFMMLQTITPCDRIESTGIGLAIVKKLAELNGGKAWVESDIGKGSTFSFTLPK
jgi:signal transduction histidine kinase